jgi:hypothetical protein
MQPLPDSDPPFFFRRVWTGGVTAQDEILAFSKQGDTYVVDLSAQAGEVDPSWPVVSLEVPDDGLVIYGRKVVSRYAEDADAMAQYERQGLVFSECFSEWCVEGELGSHPLATVTEISREEFEAARKRGWA